MTRAEKIKQVAEELAKDAYCDKHNLIWFFKKGAEWADKTMLDKVYKWLEENMQDYANCVYDGEELTDEARVSNNLMKDLRKAMEEQQ